MKLLSFGRLFGQRWLQEGSGRKRRNRRRGLPQMSSRRPLVVEHLEDRTLLSNSSLPMPIPGPPVNITSPFGGNTPSGINHNHFSSSITVDHNDPLKMVAVYITQHPEWDVAPDPIRYVVEGSYSIDGGHTWSALVFNPDSGGTGGVASVPTHGIVLYDPALPGPPPRHFQETLDPAVAFDSQHHFYVTWHEQGDHGGATPPIASSSAIVFEGFDFSGAAPAADNLPTFIGAGGGADGHAKILYESGPLGPAAITPTVTADGNQASFTDPTTGATVTDPFVNDVYVAWVVEPGSVWVRGSADGGVNFTPVRYVTPPSGAGNAAPQLVVSQGTADGRVPPGQLGMVWDNLGGATDAIQFSRATDGGRGYELMAPTGPSTITYSNTAPTQIVKPAVSSTITIPAHGIVSSLTVSLDITYPSDQDLSATLSHTDLVTGATTSVLLFSGVGGTGANFTGTTFSDSANLSITAGTAPFTGTWLAQGNPLGTFAGSDFKGTWTLTISNGTTTVGTLRDWSLTITYDSSFIPPVPTGTITHAYPNNTAQAISAPRMSSTIDIPDDTTISKVTLHLDISYPTDGDLTATLSHTDSNGKSVEVTLFANVGGSGANFTNTTFDDAATNFINAGAAPFTGSWKIQQPPPMGTNDLAEFNGMLAQGDWVLTINDPTLHVGTLNDWGLTIQSNGFPATVDVPFTANFPAGTTLTDLNAVVQLAQTNMASTSVRLLTPDGRYLTLVDNGTAAGGGPNQDGPNPNPPPTLITDGMTGSNLGLVNNFVFVGTTFDDGGAPLLADGSHTQATGPLAQYVQTETDPNDEQFMEGSGAEPSNDTDSEYDSFGSFQDVLNAVRLNPNGIWYLEITNYSSTSAFVAGAELDFAAGLSPTFLGTAATSTIHGALTSPFSTTAAATAARGIGPDAQITSDNSLGSFAPYAGRLYIAYAGRIASTDNPPDNSDIFLIHSDDGGATWTSGDNTYSAFPAATIPVANGATPSTISSQITVPANFPLADVTVSLNISFAHDFDLSAALIAPNGDRITLFNRGLAPDGANFTGTSFNSAASRSIEQAVPPYTGVFRPVDNLHVLNSDLAAGTYTLVVSNFNTTSSGTLNSWGLTLNYVSPPVMVNDDLAATDGFSESLPGLSGRPQFQPALAVDPVTDSLVVTFYDARNDASRARVARYVAVSIDGGQTFAPETFLNPPNQLFDAITQKYVVAGPIPDNGSTGNPNRNTEFGFGDVQGVDAFDGKVYAVWTGNENGLPDGNELQDIFLGTASFAVGPRVIQSDTGPVTQALRMPTTGTTYDNTFTADGIRQLDGFTVTFDRPVDPATFTPAQVNVLYRDPNTSGHNAGTAVTVASVTPLDLGLHGPNAALAATEFFVRFQTPQNQIGTYSYTIGPGIRDDIRSPTVTRVFYPVASQENLTVPPVGTGGSGNPAQDITTSQIVVSGVPSTEQVLQLEVNLTILHQFDPDLVITLTAPNGAQAILVDKEPNVPSTGLNFIDTTFKDFTLPISSPFADEPFTGTFAPETPLTVFQGLSGSNLNGVWTLSVDDTKALHTGTLVDWSLRIQTHDIAGNAAQLGNYMDQNANGDTLEDPSQRWIQSTQPGDLYSVPTPDPNVSHAFTTYQVNQQQFTGLPIAIAPPFTTDSLPLIIPGPHVVTTFTYPAPAGSLGLAVPPLGTGGSGNPANDVTTSTLTINGDPLTQIKDLKVHLTLIHPHAGDLVITLIAPDGTKVTLAQNRGGKNSNAQGYAFYDTTFTDSGQSLDPGLNPNAIDSSNGAFAFTGDFAPDQPLSTLDGKFLNGTWTLTINDTVAESQGEAPGQLVFWSLEADTTSTSLNRSVSSFDVVFDRNMNPASFTADAITSLMGPGGQIVPNKTYSAQGLPQTILAAPPQGAPTPLVSTITVNDNYQVFDLKVALNISYTNDSGLAATLIAPDGTTVPLFANVGGSGQNFGDNQGHNTIFDDAASTPIGAGTAPFIGVFQPIGHLHSLNFKNINGAWQLVITDSLPGQAGTLNSWSLIVNTVTVTPDPSEDAQYAPAGTTPDASHPRTYRVTVPSALLSGTYTVTFGPHIADPKGNPLDTHGTALDMNLNAGVDMLRDAVPVAVPPVPEFVSNAPALTLPPSSTTTSTITVNDPFTIQSLTLQLNITDPSDQDLTATLTGPDGTKVTLFSGVGGTGANFGDTQGHNTIFDDSASTSITAGIAPFLGSFKIQDSAGLAKFAGKNSQGTWVLTLVNGSGSNSGSLKNWSLSIRTGSSTNVYTNTPRVGLPPHQVTSSQVTVTDNFLIQGLTVAVNITDPNDPDLIATLIAPDGTAVRLFQKVPPAGTRQNFGDSHGNNTIFDDASLNSIQSGVSPAIAPFIGTFRPLDLLGTLKNHIATGTWTLEIENDGTSNIGALNSWSMTFLKPVSSVLLNEPARDTPVAIGDPNVTGTISTSVINVTDDFLIGGITLDLSITYANDPDLQATLVAPDGTRIKLFTHVGKLGNRNFSNTLFDDAAATPIDLGNGPFYGRFAPESQLSLLKGRSAKGQWVLVIEDDASGTIGQLNSWSLNLVKAVPSSGLGEPVADQATTGFRVFTLDPANPLSHSTWTPVGPASINNNFNAGRVTAVAVDPSDPSGNTVYIGAASGGVWKTTDFLTSDPSGPTYVPLTDFGPSFGINIGSLDVVPRNNNPNQSMIFAVTGVGDAPTDTPTGITTTERGVGFLRSMDGGATWTLLDSQTNVDAAGNPLPLNSPQRNHVFSFNSGGGGASAFKLVADPRPSISGQAILYAAMSGPNGGIWTSVDSGNHWSHSLTGSATDVLLDPNSGFLDAQLNPTGNLDYVYAAIQGQGVFLSENRGTNWSQVLGNIGDPTILDSVTDAAIPVTTAPSPNAAAGRIVLAKPALTGDPVKDLLYQGWLYAAAVNADGSFNGLFMTKDLGQNWTKIRVPITATGAASNDGLKTDFNVTDSLIGNIGNYALSLAVDPTNPNVVYLGGNTLIRVDTTVVTDAHAFYLGQNNNDGGQLYFSTGDGVVFDPLAGPGSHSPLYEPHIDPFVNLIQDPFKPFQANTTINVFHTLLFTNGGLNAPWTEVDSFFAGTDNVHRLLTITDPLTGHARLIVSDDQGIYTAVDDNGTFMTSDGTDTVPFGSRNGNLQIAEFFHGASQPSELAAQVAVLQGMFYGMSLDNAYPQSDPNVLTNGNLGWTNPIPPKAIGDGTGVATDQTGSGTVYQSKWPDAINRDNNPPSPYDGTDFFQVDGVSRTGPNLIQSVTGGDLTHDPQWPNEPSFNFAVNPVNGNEIIFSSAAGAVFGTSDQGRLWVEIGKPTALDSSNAEALTFGAPDPNGPLGSGPTNAFLYAGTVNGHIFVTFDGGGQGQQQGFNWINLSAGLDGSPVRQIVTNPNRASHEAYAVTANGVYHMVDSTAANAAWVKLTGNLPQVIHNLFNPFNEPFQLTDTQFRNLGTIQADWRYLIPDDPTQLNNANYTGPVHPVLYVGGEDGVFRSIDGGKTWTVYPDIADDGAKQDGGYLPNANVTDLSLALGNINPTTGQPDVATGTDILLATTFGRGAFAIRTAPIVVPGSLRLDPNLPAPFGSNPGPVSGTISVLTPFIDGMSEQSAFGNNVKIEMYDLSNGYTVNQDGSVNAPNIGIDATTGSPFTITDQFGRFAIEVKPGYLKADGTSDGVKIFGIRAIDAAGTIGNLATFSFTLNTTPSIRTDPASSVHLDPTYLTLNPPVKAPGGSDTGLSPTDKITKDVTPVIDGAVNQAAPVQVQIFDTVLSPNTPIGTGMTDVNGFFQIQINAGVYKTDGSTDGSHTLKVIAVHVPNDSNPVFFTFTLDTLKPATPPAPSLLPTSDSSNGQFITNISTPTFAGTGDATDSGTIVLLFATNVSTNVTTQVGQAALDNLGNYNVTVNPTPLADGAYKIQVQVEDPAGNFSGLSPAMQQVLTIRTTLPATPTVALDPSSETIPGNATDTAAVPAVLDITAAGGTSIRVLDNGTVIDSFTMPSSGVTTRPENLAEGIHPIVVTSSDVANNTATSATLILTIDSSALDSDRIFIRSLYSLDLGRPGTQPEWNLWLPVLNQPNGRTIVANDIDRSAEARDFLVKGWYSTYLGRTAQNGEELGFVSMLITGSTEEQTLGLLLSSGEYFQHSASVVGAPAPSNTTFVQALYIQLLNRQASAGEIGVWTGLLGQGMSRQQVATLILTSVEYRRDVVTGFYINLLRRPTLPSQAEVDSWALSPLDITSIRVGFEGSDEYFFRVTGLKP